MWWCLHLCFFGTICIGFLKSYCFVAVPLAPFLHLQRLIYIVRSLHSLATSVQKTFTLPKCCRKRGSVHWSLCHNQQISTVQLAYLEWRQIITTTIIVFPVLGVVSCVSFFLSISPCSLSLLIMWLRSCRLYEFYNSLLFYYVYTNNYNSYTVLYYNKNKRRLLSGRVLIFLPSFIFWFFPLRNRLCEWW